MRIPVVGSRFKRDVKRMERRGREMSKLRTVIQLLIEGDPLPPELKDHPLSGDWKHFRDCHIEPDWVLIYKIDGNELYLVQTGTHADLFN
jgi:mRNA interferase YafQ